MAGDVYKHNSAIFREMCRCPACTRDARVREGLNVEHTRKLMSHWEDSDTFRLHCMAQGPRLYEALKAMEYYCISGAAFNPEPTLCGCMGCKCVVCGNVRGTGHLDDCTIGTVLAACEAGL